MPLFISRCAQWLNNAGPPRPPVLNVTCSGRASQAAQCPAGGVPAPAPDSGLSPHSSALTLLTPHCLRSPASLLSITRPPWHISLQHPGPLIPGISTLVLIVTSDAGLQWLVSSCHVRSRHCQVSSSSDYPVYPVASFHSSYRYPAEKWELKRSPVAKQRTCPRRVWLTDRVLSSKSEVQ